MAIGIYNGIHPGFSIKFIDRCSQIALAQIYCSRINLENPLDYAIVWNCQLDRNSSRGFHTLTVGELNATTILNFPLLPQQLFNPLVFDVTGGPAPILGASGILSYMSFRLIKEQNPQFSVHEVQEAICLSNDIPLQYFIQDSEPLNWNTDIFGSFRPCTVVRMRCPPSHKSDSNPANWKFAVIVFSDIPNQRLMIRGPLSKILFWKCFGCPSEMGLMRTCKHTTALLMVLGFQYAFSPKTLSVSLLNPKAAPGCQTTGILPETSTGGWALDSLGSERISQDTRRNNILYTSNNQSHPSSTAHVVGLGVRNSLSQTVTSVYNRTQDCQSVPTQICVDSITRSASSTVTSFVQCVQSVNVSRTQATSAVCNTVSSLTSISIPAIIPSSSALQVVPSGPNVLSSTDNLLSTLCVNSVAENGNGTSVVHTAVSMTDNHMITTTSTAGDYQILTSSVVLNNNHRCGADREVIELMRVIDPNLLFPIPRSSQYTTMQDFQFIHLQQKGLLNVNGTSCYMNTIILLLHKIGMKFHILDNAYLSSSITRNYGRSLITKLIKQVLEALPSSMSFSIVNVIAAWQHLNLQAQISLGVSEDAAEVLASLLNNLLLKVGRSSTGRLLTKFRGQLTCRKTRDCVQFELADSYVGQADVSPYLHVVGVDSTNDHPIKLRDRLHNFITSTFDSQCQAIMCKKRVRGARIEVEKGKYTLIGLNRNNENRAKALNKVDLADHSPEVNGLSYNPVAVISHVGSMTSGHYIIYSKVNGHWYLNDDNKSMLRCQSSPFEQNYSENETADIIVFENELL